MKLFEEYLKPLKAVGVETITKETLIDEYSKKLKLKEHLKLLIYSIIEDCTTLTALCESLHSTDTKRKGLIPISKAICGKRKQRSSVGGYSMSCFTSSFTSTMHCQSCVKRLA